MRSTRSSALRCPSCLRNALTIRSRLPERLVPAGRSRSRSGMAVAVAMTLSLCRERRAATAGGRRVGVLNREPATRDGVDEIDLSTLEVADADRIDEKAHAVRLEQLVADAAGLFDHQ